MFVDLCLQSRLPARSCGTLGITVTYHDGSIVRLGDIVKAPIPMGTAKARVVMLGDTYEHLDIDAQFVSG
jgi:hypothetical protein